MARDHRRLAAIVSLDIVGYSRLMGKDDSGTLAALKAHRRELIDPKIAEHNGRIVKTTGDGMLLDFSSVVDAVRCAVEVQRGMAERNAGIEPEQRLEFRIGINVGDIIIDGDDIFGDGVNVAARLQALADPGGICVSRVVRDQVLDKLGFRFEDLGARQVKNIVRPVEAYRISQDPPVSGGQPKRAAEGGDAVSAALDRVRWSWLAGATAALIVVGVVVWHAFVQPRPSATSSDPPLMSVAVMPFASASTSLDDERIAERLTKDITTGIARSQRSAQVASHGLVATKYRGKATDPRAVGRDLNVRYLVEGEVRDERGMLAVVTQLVDTRSGTQLWGTRVEVPGGADGNKDEIIAQLTNRVQQALYDAEKKRVANLPKKGANAMELVLHADTLWKEDPSPNGRIAARKLYEEALRQDPASVPAMGGVMETIEDELKRDARADWQRLVKEMDELSVRAVQADRNDPRAWMYRTAALVWRERWDAAFEASSEAMRIDPFRDITLGTRAWLLILSGRSEEALPVLDRAIALDPQRSDPWFIYGQCQAHLSLGHYDAAIAACEKFVALEGEWYGHVFLAGAYAQKGDMARAAAEKEETLKLDKELTITGLKALRLWRNPIFLQQMESHLFAGLRKAGVPEQ